MKHTQLFIIIGLLLMALALSACGSAQAASKIPEVVIKTHDFAFEAPVQIEAGLVSITLINDGQEPHHAQLARLNDGVTMDQFQVALQQGEAAVMAALTFVGGPGLLDPGLSQTVTLELTPGQYVLLCFVPSHDGVPHLAKGMVTPLKVAAHTDPAQTSAPKLEADMTVKLRDFVFPLPSKIKAGQQVWRILNEGSQPHEIMITKLAEGKTIEDAQAFLHTFTGAPPFANIGGFQALTPGESGWLNLDLEPGEYVALCYVPNPESGKPHFAHGMIQPFSVR